MYRGSSACTPPIHGEIPAATVAAMSMAGADEIYILGGVQAVTAMALGTESIERVDLIAGPGNAYVAEAKRQLFGEVGIDLFAGPTEILVDRRRRGGPVHLCGRPVVAGRARAGVTGVVLVTTSEALGREVVELIERILPEMPTRDYAEPAWRDYGQVIVVDDIDEAYRVADGFAFEHVQVLTAEPRRALDRHAQLRGAVPGREHLRLLR